VFLTVFVAAFVVLAFLVLGRPILLRCLVLRMTLLLRTCWLLRARLDCWLGLLPLILTGRCFRFGGRLAWRRIVSGCATRGLLIRVLRGRVTLLSALG
jgi:hypothetical protein